MPNSLITRYQEIKHRLDKTAQQFNRKRCDMHLLAVSKTHNSQNVQTCYDLGQREFGENYLQDALTKIQTLSHLTDIQWHFIGPIQSNKTKSIAENFQWVETLSRIKIAERLSRQRPRYLPPLNVLVQINISQETQKEGIAITDAYNFCEQVQALPMLKLRGLMCIAQNTENQKTLENQYHTMHTIFNDLKQHYPNFDRLSMGMSNDMELAIAQGSNQVRIGSDIFGKRKT